MRPSGRDMGRGRGKGRGIGHMGGRISGRGTASGRSGDRHGIVNSNGRTTRLAKLVEIPEFGEVTDTYAPVQVTGSRKLGKSIPIKENYFSETKNKHSSKISQPNSMNYSDIDTNGVIIKQERIDEVESRC